MAGPRSNRSPERAEVILEVVGHDDVFANCVFTVVPLQQAMPVDPGIPYPADPNRSAWTPATGGYAICRNVLIDRSGLISVCAYDYTKAVIFSAISNYASAVNGSYIFRVTALLKDGRVVTETKQSTYVDGGQTDQTTTRRAGIDLSASGKAGVASLGGKASLSGENVDKTTGARTVQRTDTTTRTEGAQTGIGKILAEPRAHMDGFSMLSPALSSPVVGLG